MKNALLLMVKIGVSAAILFYLVQGARQSDVFDDFWSQPKSLSYLAVAFVFCAAAVALTMVRWHLLVRALNIPTRLGNSMRIALLGYLFNLAPAGIVGGDVIKAVMLARPHKNVLTKSFASVILDRVLGLYMLFVVASVAIFVTRLWQYDGPAIWSICVATWAIAVVGGLGAGLMMVPAVTDGKLVRRWENHPRLGPGLSQVLDAIRLYRGQPRVLAVSALMTVGVHVFFAIGVYFVSRGLFAESHSLSTHLVVSPLSMAAGVVPLPLGPFEYLLDMFYHLIPLGALTVPQGQGLVVSFGYRLITIGIAAVGAVYYIVARQEVGQLLGEMKQAQTDNDKTGLAGAHFDQAPIEKAEANSIVVAVEAEDSAA